MFFKKNMFIAAFLVAIFLPVSVFALNLGSKLAEDAATGAGYAKATETTLAENIGFIIQVALSFVGTIFLVLVVYGGILWMTARGDEGQVDKSKEIIQRAVIGLVITVGAYSITAFVVPRIVEQSSGRSGIGTERNNVNNTDETHDPACVTACENQCERTTEAELRRSGQDPTSNVGPVQAAREQIFNACMNTCTNSCE